MKLRHFAPVVFASIALGACQMDSRNQALETSASAVQLRSFQSRAFDTVDRETTLRTVIATLQDLGFVVDSGDLVLGTVSATKLDGYALRMTVSARPRNESQLVVRASAQYNTQAVEDPMPYQQFFAALEKSMFLQAHAVE
jgi:Na+/H+-dicarboxylate symporter